MKIMGIDEAGRGSVLGPMTVGAFIISDEQQIPLRDTGVTDSKRLSRRRREALIPIMAAVGTSDLVLVSARAIDAGNLNKLEQDAMVTLLEAHRPDRVYIDAPTHPRAIPRFVEQLRSRLSYQPEMVVEPKADLNYPVVSAASVVAKVRRDQEVRTLGPVGSGYPSDPVTRAWILQRLREGGPLPPCVRSRWGTIGQLSQQLLF